jgi:hypothetical protein
LPAGVRLHIPQAFAQVTGLGNQVAGERAWGFQDCEVALAWAPGPTERLLIDNARVMAEATYPQDNPELEISVKNIEEITWGDEENGAFLFVEEWKKADRDTPAETLIVQGPDYRLYALRIRARSEEEIHPLCRDVRGTLHFVEPD